MGDADKHFKGRFFFVIGLLALASGMYGYSIDKPSLGCPLGGCQSSWERAFLVVLENFYRSVQHFVLEGDPGLSRENGWVIASRLLAPMATAGAIYGLLAARLGSYFHGLRSRRCENHTIIIGKGQRALHFAKSSLAMGGKVVFINPNLSPQLVQFCKDNGQFHVAGDPLQKETYARANLDQASNIVVLQSGESENLAVVSVIKSAVDVSRDNRIRLFLHIADPSLLTQIENDESFLKGCSRLDIAVFSLARQTARRFFENHPLVDWADSNGSGRVNLAFIGLSDVTVELLAQLARLSPFEGFDRPRVHIFAEDEDDIGPFLDARIVHLNKVLDIHTYSLPRGRTVPNDEQMMAVEVGEGSSPCKLTAVFIAFPDQSENVVSALKLRAHSIHVGLWAAPVFCNVFHGPSFETLFTGTSEADSLADVVETFGAVASLCALTDLDGTRENIARDVHKAYLRFKGIEPDTPVENRGEADYPWEALPETYRNSNRRAADRLPMMLLTAGLGRRGQEPRLAEGESLIADPKMFERLARLEHESWNIGRLLDGWRPGPDRDKRRKIHPYIGDYEDLPENIKDYDRDQIRVIERYLKRGEGE